MTKSVSGTDIGDERVVVKVIGDTSYHQEIVEVLENEVLELKNQIEKRR